MDGILRADAIGALRTGLLFGSRPVDNRPQDAILPHCLSAGCQKLDYGVVLQGLGCV